MATNRSRRTVSRFEIIERAEQRAKKILADEGLTFDTLDFFHDGQGFFTGHRERWEARQIVRWANDIGLRAELEPEKDEDLGWVVNVYIPTKKE